MHDFSYIVKSYLMNSFITFFKIPANFGNKFTFKNVYTPYKNVFYFEKSAAISQNAFN